MASKSIHAGILIVYAGRGIWDVIYAPTNSLIASCRTRRAALQEARKFPEPAHA